MKYFYAHIIQIETLTIALDEMDLAEEQKVHLAFLVDSTIHHTVLDVIFGSLPSEHHAYFVERLKLDPGDKGIMDFLTSKSDNIESLIIQSVEELKESLHEDIEQAKVLHQQYKGGKNK